VDGAECVPGQGDAQFVPPCTRLPGPPAPGECGVWWAERVAVRPWHDAALSPTELRLRERFRLAEDRAQFTLTAVLTRVVLGSLLSTKPSAVELDYACTHCHGWHAVPRRLCGQPDLAFSVSSCADWSVVAAVASGRVGMVLEQASEDPRATRLGRHILSAAEHRELQRLPPVDQPWALTRYWLRKEAILKAAGADAGETPSLINVSAPWDAPRLLAWDGRAEPPTPLSLHDLATPRLDLVSSLAVIGVADVGVRAYEVGRALSSYGAPRGIR
jgi:4'-phosphopantetheinyl transferase